MKICTVNECDGNEKQINDGARCVTCCVLRYSSWLLPWGSYSTHRKDSLAFPMVEHWLGPSQSTTSIASGSLLLVLYEDRTCTTFSVESREQASCSYSTRENTRTVAQLWRFRS
ncbi:unnamed protein product [Tuber aestivum]|uniref:Uncharacterized protein n=1 Tax=Tuber aestivum TaxID=59557 RepID=A0A292PX59_9PEZI|nr:unnamed protein product [Tuber aestivum]